MTGSDRHSLVGFRCLIVGVPRGPRLRNRSPVGLCPPRRRPARAANTMPALDGGMAAPAPTASRSTRGSPPTAFPSSSTIKTLDRTTDTHRPRCARLTAERNSPRVDAGLSLPARRHVSRSAARASACRRLGARAGAGIAGARDHHRDEGAPSPNWRAPSARQSASPKQARSSAPASGRSNQRLDRRAAGGVSGRATRRQRARRSPRRAGPLPSSWVAVTGRGSPADVRCVAFQCPRTCRAACAWLSRAFVRGTCTAKATSCRCGSSTNATTSSACWIGG